MSDPVVNKLLEVLTLKGVGRTKDDMFLAENLPMPHGRIFGGQVLAQAFIAANKTVADDRFAHSMHGYFLRAGEPDEDTTFSVERIYDGRSFSTRLCQAYQGGQPIFSMIASFQDRDPGLDHQTDIDMSQYPEPESLPTTRDVLGNLDHPIARFWMTERPFDIRHIPNSIYLSVEGEQVASQAVWAKVDQRLPDDPELHKAALTFLSDYTLLESVMRKHGVPWSTRGLKVASLDHAIWWHRDARVDEWLLYVQESPSAQGGRGLATGRIYNRAGQLILSVAQEGMVRVPQAL